MVVGAEYSALATLVAMGVRGKVGRYKFFYFAGILTDTKTFHCSLRHSMNGWLYLYYTSHVRPCCGTLEEPVS